MPISELERRAAQVRRDRARREAQHGPLDLALSIKCPAHGTRRGQPCYPPPAAGVCRDRYDTAHAAATRARGRT